MKKPITPPSPAELASQIADLNSVFPLPDNLRDQIEIAVYDAIDPTSPDGSLRAVTIDTLTKLAELGALDEQMIEQAREARFRQANAILEQLGVRLDLWRF